MKRVVLVAVLLTLVITTSASAQITYMRFLDGSLLPQSSGWILRGKSPGTVVDLKGANKGIQATDPGEGWAQWSWGHDLSECTLGAFFRVDDCNNTINTDLIELHAASVDSPALGIGIRDTERNDNYHFWLVEWAPDYKPLVDLGAVVKGQWHKVYIYVNTDTAQARVRWDDQEVYNGTPSSWRVGGGLAIFGASTANANYGGDKCSVTFDWVGLWPGYAATTVIDAINAANLDWVHISGAVVTEVFPTEMVACGPVKGGFAIRTADSSEEITVTSGADVKVGDTVSILGKAATVFGKRLIRASSVTVD